MHNIDLYSEYKIHYVIEACGKTVPLDLGCMVKGRHSQKVGNQALQTTNNLIDLRRPDNTQV